MTTMPDLSSWRSCAARRASSSRSEGQLADDIVAVRVERARSSTCIRRSIRDAKLEPIRTGDPTALDVIRHSTAHVMADAVQRLFPGHQGHHRSGHRQTASTTTSTGPTAPFTDEGPRARSRRRCARSSAGHALPPRSDRAATRRHALFEKMGENYKVEHHRRHPRGRGDLALPPRQPDDREWVDLCEGPHVPTHRATRAP